MEVGRRIFLVLLILRGRLRCHGDGVAALAAPGAPVRQRQAFVLGNPPSPAALRRSGPRRRRPSVSLELRSSQHVAATNGLRSDDEEWRRRWGCRTASGLGNGHTFGGTVRIRGPPSPPAPRSSSSSSSLSSSGGTSPDPSSSSSSATATASPPAITVENLSCSHDGGSTYQLRDVSYVLPRGGKVGLLGRNGCGKSTFLRILSVATAAGAGSGLSSDGGDEGGPGDGVARRRQYENLVYSGRVETAKNCRVVSVEQEPPMPSDVTVSSALLGITASASPSSSSTSPSDGANLSPYEAARRYRLAELRAADGDPDGLASASALMDASSGWDVLTRADEIATRLRIDHLLDQPLSDLSGGERKRVALAAALVQDPDVLLLDEPTNHLDLSAIRWLSDVLIEQQRRKQLTCLVVTHDRAFLEEVCRDGMLELDRGSIHAYRGMTYAGFLEAKEERLALEDAAAGAARARYRRELDWMRRQPKARETKAKARIDAFHKLEGATKPRAGDPSLSIDGGEGQRRIGKNILKCKNVNLSFGDRTILDDFTYDFNGGDRIGVVGANGVGKSTFLKVLTGRQPIDGGEVSTGETVVFGVYDQMGLELDDPDQRVLEFVKDRVAAGDGSSMAEAPQEAMKLLRQFEFPSDRWNERVSMLSGGERRRLQLLSVVTKRPNFLILDEPTNDIDLDTLSALERYLEDFRGVLVIVSHDRFFTDKVTDHLFVFEGDGVVKDYIGSLSDYAECLLAQEDEGTGASASAGATSDLVNKKSAYKEDKDKRLAKVRRMQKLKRELNGLEPTIEKLKIKSEAIQQEIDNSGGEGWSVVADLAGKLQAVSDEVDEKENRWLELAEIIEQEEGVGGTS